ncbi:putative signal peptide protein [Puccinia sorghi]|uniref:Putative signal peptide protein n=1 Tax=Puccinia sorghi TaxID=27349 RepID=A0A0L6V678_9BASI|nr:putative signal peptide protein [Puccinia sorghi]
MGWLIAELWSCWGQHHICFVLLRRWGCPPCILILNKPGRGSGASSCIVHAHPYILGRFSHLADQQNHWAHQKLRSHSLFSRYCYRWAGSLDTLSGELIALYLVIMKQLVKVIKQITCPPRSYAYLSSCLLSQPRSSVGEPSLNFVARFPDPVVDFCHRSEEFPKTHTKCHVSHFSLPPPPGVPPHHDLFNYLAYCWWRGDLTMARMQLQFSFNKLIAKSAAAGGMIRFHSFITSIQSIFINCLSTIAAARYAACALVFKSQTLSVVFIHNTPPSLKVSLGKSANNAKPQTLQHNHPVTLQLNHLIKSCCPFCQSSPILRLQEGQITVVNVIKAKRDLVKLDSCSAEGSREIETKHIKHCKNNSINCAQLTCSKIESSCVSVCLMPRILSYSYRRCKLENKLEERTTLGSSRRVERVWNFSKGSKELKVVSGEINTRWPVYILILWALFSVPSFGLESLDWLCCGVSARLGQAKPLSSWLRLLILVLIWPKIIVLVTCFQVAGKPFCHFGPTRGFLLSQLVFMTLDWPFWESRRLTLASTGFKTVTTCLIRFIGVFLKTYIYIKIFLFDIFLYTELFSLFFLLAGSNVVASWHCGACSAQCGPVCQLSSTCLKKGSQSFHQLQSYCRGNPSNKISFNSWTHLGRLSNISKPTCQLPCFSNILFLFSHFFSHTWFFSNVLFFFSHGFHLSFQCFQGLISSSHSLFMHHSTLLPFFHSRVTSIQKATEIGSWKGN